MKRQFLFISLLAVFSLLVTGCGGGGNQAPVDMEQEETSTFSIERPKAWKTNSMDLFGITVLVVSSADISAESVLGGGDMSTAFADAPGALIMTVPQKVAEEGGDFGFSADEVQALADSGENVEIMRQGDVTVDGVKGYEFVGKGEIEELGSGKMGVHLGVLEPKAGPLAFMGFSPETDMDKNMDIFEYMFESIKFK